MPQRAKNPRSKKHTSNQGHTIESVILHTGIRGSRVREVADRLGLLQPHPTMPRYYRRLSDPELELLLTTLRVNRGV